MTQDHPDDEISSARWKRIYWIVAVHTAGVIVALWAFSKIFR